MIYPKFLKENDTIGICAPSSGVGEKLESFDCSMDGLRRHGFRLYETKSVRNSGDTSADGGTRAKELMELFENDAIDAVFCASGGDFLMEMLPYVDLEVIRRHPKWLMGASDPSSLLYWITTEADIATFYGFNAGSFDQNPWHDSLETACDFWKGDWHLQQSFARWQSEKRNGNYVFDQAAAWKALNTKDHAKGRLIGGCIDVLRDLIGTKRDGTLRFLNRYPEESIVWYFDVFSLTAEDFYRALFQMREAGWFRNVAGVLTGRVLFPGASTAMTYETALKRIFGEDVLLVTEADIGHTVPRMILVNGAVCEVQTDGAKGNLQLQMA